MSNSPPPLFDFPKQGTFTGMLLHAYRAMLLNTDDMLPAKIISFDRIKNVATVQPQIKILGNDGSLVSKAPQATVPVFTLGGGNFLISFPLQAGNTGWIKANDRDISLYVQGGIESKPNTDTLHSFEHGVFFPDIMSNYTLASGDNSNMVIQSSDGTVKITLGPGAINMDATNIFLTATNVDIVSSTLFHNGKNIGSTHDHTLVQPGSGISGPPV
jgi:hypothetical protein